MGDFREPDAHERYFKGQSAFWNFAQAVSNAADHDCKDLSNIAWSNIFKQGVTAGNPTGEIADSQRESAVDTLREEVCRLKPSLIVLVNAGYYEELVKSAFEIIDGEVGDDALKRTAVEGESKWDFWSRAAYKQYPTLVWMYHPQGKRKQYTNAALDLVKAVTGW
jgi:hypothetical protein